MFKVLDRYLMTHLLAGTLLALMVIVALDAFFSFLNELDDVGRGQYDAMRAFLYILLTLPRRLYEFAPTATLLGGLLVLGTLASQGELTAMRAAGLSIFGLAVKVLKTGVVIVVALFLLGELVAPAAEQRGQGLRAEALSEQLSIRGGQGLWVRHQPWFVQARQVVSDEHLLDVRIFRFEGPQLRELVTAKSARRNEAGWLLQDVEKVDVAADAVRRTRIQQEQWPELVTRQLFEVLRVHPDQMSIQTLSTYIRYLRDNGLDTARYELARWSRLSVPLSTLVMLLLALPFVFTAQRSGGTGQRLFIGILLGIGYFLLTSLFNELGVVYGLPPLLSAALPLMAATAFAVWRLRTL